MKTRRLLLLALLFCWPLLAPASDDLLPSQMKTKDQLHAVISSQLAAFRANDFAAAYVFADEGIKRQVAVEQFEMMVRHGYPAIAKSASATFGLTFDNGDEAVVNVRVVGANAQEITYQYMLRRSGEAWRITGVVPLKEQTTEV